METVEPEKMEWMRDLDQEKDEAPPEEFSARSAMFCFSQELITRKKCVTSGLLSNETKI